MNDNYEIGYPGTTTVRHFSGDTLVNEAVFRGNSTLILSSLHALFRDPRKGFGSITHVECWWQGDDYKGTPAVFHRQWRLEID